MRAKLLVAALLLALAAPLCGCGSAVSMEDGTDRFSNLGWYSNWIVVDRETGVMYLMCGNGSVAGITVLLGADGKPLTVEEEA